MPDIEGVPYEAAGTALDVATAQALAARHREAAAAGVRAEAALPGMEAATTAAQARADAAYALADAAATPAMVDQKVSTATTGLVTEAALAEALDGFSGGGVESVSGTVTLDATGEPIREFFTTGATVFQANGTTVTIGAGVAVVWRRTVQGSWGYQVVQDGWTTPTPTPDTTAPVAGTLAVAVTDVKADLTVSGASDDRGVVSYAFSKDNGTTWTAYQDAATYTFTGLTAATSYTFRHRVKDAAGNVTTGTAVSKTTNETPPRVADWAGLEAIIKADAPALYFPLDDPAGTTTVTSEGTWSEAGTTTGTPENVVFNGEYADFNGTNARIQGAGSSGVALHTGTTAVTAGTMEAVVKVDTVKQTSIFGPFTEWHLGMASGKFHGAMGNSAFAAAVAAVAAGQTYHLMHTFDGATSKLYVNGVLAGSTADTRTIPAQRWAGFGMGDGAAGWYDGTIRHAAVYMGKALTEADALERAQKAGLA